MILIVISLIVRLVSLFVMFYKVLPVMAKEYLQEDNGLKKLKFFLLSLGITFLIANIFPLSLQVCRVTEWCSAADVQLIQWVTFFNSLDALVGAILFYMVYTKRY